LEDKDMARDGAGRLKYSALKTDDALIRTGWLEFFGITISTDGANAVTVDLHDGTSVAGAKICPTLNFPATPITQSFGIAPGVECTTGLYVNITVAGGGTCSYTIYYYSV
jgi:hypothetical protein